MGFGSYDESEQQQQTASNDDDEDRVVNVHQNVHNGEMSVENGDSTEDLIGQLQDIKEQKAADDE